MSHGRVPQNRYKPFTIHHRPPQKSLTLAAATPHALPPCPCATYNTDSDAPSSFFLRTMSSSHDKKAAVPASKKRKGAASSSGPTMEIRHLFLQFHLGGLVRQLSVPEFEISLGQYTKEFMDDNDLDTLYRHIYYSPSKCWRDLVLALATYNPSRSKASAFPPSLRYLHAILVHTLTGR
ncbi:hypothetical protein PVK06_008397 [Gossypium arboreum]|uniref:Uncharacterized protein n=1 Tax=Gossypium arboreum TaxID=29729 RepID=A0ABR0QJV8_GOSAR|nr:hypothetical protein PVK06_008397 [Gossypium arboreum]